MTAAPDLAGTRALLAEVRALVEAAMPEVEAARYDITIKPDGSPVTAADRLLELRIRDFLAARLPGLAFAGEETFEAGQTVPRTGFFAILDPIDGTENFCSGLKEWGVSLTLWHDGVHLGSMLLLPELDACLMTGDRLDYVPSRIRGFSSSMCPEILDGMAQTQESRLMGCSVYNMYNVIRGSFTRFTNPRGAYAWDLLPGLMLALEHGCAVEVEGQPYDGYVLEPGQRYRVDIRHGHHLHPGQGSVG